MKVKCVRVWYAGRFIGKSYYTRCPGVLIFWLKIRYILEAWVVYDWPSMEERSYWDRGESEGKYFTPLSYRKGIVSRHPDEDRDLFRHNGIVSGSKN